MSGHVRQPLVVVLAGSASLAIAMGVGRFAFTPIMPMMLRDGVLELDLANKLATANYIGYLIGALLSMSVPKKWDHTLIVRLALVLTVMLTALMAMPLQSAWLALRFLAGVVSAVGFVFTSGWCLRELSRHPGSIGSAIYTGPGAGIALSGIAASVMTTLGLSGRTAWVVFAIISALLSTIIWKVFSAGPQATSSPIHKTVAARGRAKDARAEMPLFAIAYGLAGFGYIITATYLPIIAKNVVPDSSLLTVFWPMFGLAAVAGSLFAARAPSTIDARILLIGTYLAQAIGVALSVLWQTGIGLALSSVLVGLPFTAISFFAMNEVRRIRPNNQARYIGLLTSVFAIGQILGPPLVSQIFGRVADLDIGFSIALGIASSALVAGAAIYAAMVVLWPSTLAESRTVKTD